MRHGRHKRKSAWVFLAVALALLAIAAKAHAEDELEQWCEQKSITAIYIEGAHQKGVPLKDALTIVDLNLDKVDPADRDLARKTMHALVRAAYERPIHKTKEEQAEEAAEFAHVVYIDCLANGL